MPDEKDWMVPLTLVRDADRPARPAVRTLPAQRIPRMADLRRRVRDGHYASESMMDAVARRLLASGVVY